MDSPSGRVENPGTTLRDCPQVHTHSDHTSAWWARWWWEVPAAQQGKFCFAFLRGGPCGAVCPGGRPPTLARMRSHQVQTFFGGLPSCRRPILLRLVAHPW